MSWTLICNVCVSAPIRLGCIRLNVRQTADKENSNLFFGHKKFATSLMQWQTLYMSLISVVFVHSSFMRFCTVNYVGSWRKARIMFSPSDNNVLAQSALLFLAQTKTAYRREMSVASKESCCFVTKLNLHIIIIALF